MAHFRESNAVHLEVLDVVPALNVPLELDIFDGASPGTLIAHLEGAKDVAFTRAHNEVGAGSFRISVHDPKALPEIVDREHLAKVKIAGVYRFSFWMEERKVEHLDFDDEEGGEFWIVGGREGTHAVLDRAAMETYSLIGHDPQSGVWNLTAAGTGNALGQMLRRVLDERLADTPSPLEFLTLDFTYDADSLGNVWDDSADLQVNVGDGLLSIWKVITALGLDSRGRHDLRLSAYKELGRRFDVEGGTGEVVFRGGQNVTSRLSKRTEGTPVKSRLIVKGTGEEYFHVHRPDIEADPYVRRREGFLSFSNSADPTTVQKAGEADLVARRAAGAGIRFGVRHGNGPGEYEPFVHYDVGDYVTLHEPGLYEMETVRIVGITIEGEEDDYNVTLEANSIEYEAIVKLARSLAGSRSFMGSNSNLSTSGGGGGSGTSSTSKVSVQAGDTPGFLAEKTEGADGITKSVSGSGTARKMRLGVDSTLIQRTNEKGAPNGYAPLSSGILVPVEYLGSGAPDGTKFLRGDGTWAVPPGNGGGGGGDHPDLSTHDALGLATDAELAAHAAGPHGGPHDHDAEYEPLGAVAAHAAEPHGDGGEHPDLAAHDTLGLATDAELDAVKIATLLAVVDGVGAAITAGVKGDLTLDFACEIEAVTLLADQSGSIVVDIWKDSYANFPPTVGDSITASAKPTLSSAVKSQDSTLTGWTTAIAAGDVLRFHVDSAADVERVTIALQRRRT